MTITTQAKAILRIHELERYFGGELDQEMGQRGQGGYTSTEHGPMYVGSLGTGNLPEVRFPGGGATDAATEQRQIRERLRKLTAHQIMVLSRCYKAIGHKEGQLGVAWGHWFAKTKEHTEHRRQLCLARDRHKRGSSAFKDAQLLVKDLDDELMRRARQEAYDAHEAYRALLPRRYRRRRPLDADQRARRRQAQQERADAA